MDSESSSALYPSSERHRSSSSDHLPDRSSRRFRIRSLSRSSNGDSNKRRCPSGRLSQLHPGKRQRVEASDQVGESRVHSDTSRRRHSSRHLASRSRSRSRTFHRSKSPCLDTRRHKSLSSRDDVQNGSSSSRHQDGRIPASSPSPRPHLSHSTSRSTSLSGASLRPKNSTLPSSRRHRVYESTTSSRHRDIDSSPWYERLARSNRVDHRTQESIKRRIESSGTVVARKTRRGGREDSDGGSSSSSSSEIRKRNVMRTKRKKQPEEDDPETIQRRIDEAVAARVEEEVKKRVDQVLKSKDFEKEIESRLRGEKAKLEQNMRKELELEKVRVLEAFKQQEIEKQLQSQKLEEILSANERKVREEQKRLASEQAKRDEERLRELERIALQKDEDKKKRLSLAQSIRNSTNPPKVPKIAFKIGK